MQVPQAWSPGQGHFDPSPFGFLLCLTVKSSIAPSSQHQQQRVCLHSSPGKLILVTEQQTTDKTLRDVDKNITLQQATATHSLSNFVLSQSILS